MRKEITEKVNTLGEDSCMSKTVKKLIRRTCEGGGEEEEEEKKEKRTKLLQLLQTNKKISQISREKSG